MLFSFKSSLTPYLGHQMLEIRALEIPCPACPTRKGMSVNLPCTSHSQLQTRIFFSFIYLFLYFSIETYVVDTHPKDLLSMLPAVFWTMDTLFSFLFFSVSTTYYLREIKKKHTHTNKISILDLFWEQQQEWLFQHKIFLVHEQVNSSDIITTLQEIHTLSYKCCLPFTNILFRTRL